MSNVKGPENPYGDRNEFVEIYNQSPDTVDLSNYFLSDFDALPDAICAWTDESILNKYPDVRINSTLIYPYSYAIILDREYTTYDSINYQPYDIPAGTLILTTDDTSIGDGLSTNDPLIIFSPVEACTTSFGTPYLNDNFPKDPGDGISWERIDLSLPDSSNNWHPCIDPKGSTPGMKNSVTDAYDLGLDPNLISFIPAQIQTGEDVSMSIGIINFGIRQTSDYKLSIYDDRNSNGILESEELLTIIMGEFVGAFDTLFLFWEYKKPSQGKHRMGFKIDFDNDRNLENNIAFKNLQVLGKVGELCLSPEIFTPDGDGYNDQLQIDYRLPEPGGLLTISIFDSRGMKLSDLCKKMPAQRERGTLFWNGETEKGRAPTGMYIIYLEYIYHNKSTKAKKTTILAR